MSFSLKCNDIIDDYLLNNNIVYKNRYIIGIFVGLLSAEFLKLTSIKIVDKIILPICLFFISIVILKIILKLFLDNKKRKDLKEKCILWANDPKNKKLILNNNTIMVDLDEIILYNKNIENFENIPDIIIDSTNEYSVEKLPPGKINNNPSPFNINENENSKYINSGKIIDLKPKPIPGPQWNPHSAKQVASDLKNNILTKPYC